MLDGKTPRRLRREAKPARDGLREWTLREAKTRGLEVRAIPQERVEHPTEAVSDRDDRSLVPTSSIELEKVRMERMRWAPSVMSGLAEHRSELGRTPLGDMAMAITVTGLVTRRRRKAPFSIPSPVPRSPGAPRQLGEPTLLLWRGEGQGPASAGRRGGAGTASKLFGDS
jgi:hypothetical protein